MNYATTIISRFHSVSRRAAAAALAAVMLTACAEGNLASTDDPNPDAGYITLDLSNTSLPSRATEDGLNPLNENDIDHALICLFAGSEAQGADRPVFMQNVTGINAESRATVRLRINRDLISSLFPAGATTAFAYVIANLPATTTVPTDPTLADLQSLPITSDFASSAVQPNFVMDGSSIVNLNYDADNPSKSSVTGTVNLNRSAAKITLGVNVAASVTDGNDDTWTSVPSQMSVLISNGVKASKVVPDYGINADDYYSTTTNAENELHRDRSFTTAGGSEKYPYLLASPFYTYPNSWTAESETMTSMTLIVPWQKEGEARFRYCYYTVPVLRNGSQLVRNVS